MKKSMLNKIIFITLVLFIMALLILNSVKASDIDTDWYDPGELKETEAPTLFAMGKSLLGIVLNIATVVSILTIATIGTIYIFGSVEQKAEYKATLMPWLIGAALTLGISRILALIQEIATKIYPQ